MRKLSTLVEIGRTFGVRDGVLRLGYELRRGSGLMSRRLRSVRGWDSWSLRRIAPQANASQLLESRRAEKHPFFFTDARQLASALRHILGTNGESFILAEASRILEGAFPFFGRLSFACGFPPNWFRNPVTGQQVSPLRSWTTMRFASPDYGDLKYILEPSRFLFVYPLARAYALNGDERLPEAFWRLVEDWAQHNPPMEGPLWVCGQESSLRIVAWSFALRAFVHSPTTTPARCALLLSMIAAHAWRTEQTLGYARSQRSNHLISEAAGLWTAGTLYPELARAEAWQNLGTRMMREAVLDQFTADGMYLQHSFNYQRMALHVLLWTLRLAQVHRMELPPEIRARTAAGLDFLGAVVDPVSGNAPNHGANDGSLALPLTRCDYRDFRPLLQLGASVLGRPPAFGPGPWDESCLWLCGKAPNPATPSLRPSLASSTGYHRLGDVNSWALVHASQYTRRPFQADQLHVDLWWRGLNLARDAGTYLYNGEPPWDNGLSRTVAHNTMTFDGRDQMRRAGRFLWVDWAQASGKSSSLSQSAFPDYFEGSHDGYRKLGITHRRSVQYLAHAGWVILDDLQGEGKHEACLHWLLADLSVQVIAEAGFQVELQGRETRFRLQVFSDPIGEGVIVREGKALSPAALDKNAALLGFYSPTYGELSPAISLCYRIKTQLPARIVTVILAGPEIRVVRKGSFLMLQRSNSALGEISLMPVQKSSLKPLSK